MGDESAGKQGMDSPAGDARQSCSEIPEVSLCPPDNPDTGPSVIQSRTSGASSPSRQYHQHSLCPKRCHCCGQTQMADGSPCPTPVSSPNCSSSAVNMCHDSVDCHWPQGLRDMGTQQPLQRHVVTVRHEGLYRIPRSYSQLIVEFPMAVLISCTLVLLGCSLAGILVGPLPDFSDPLLGLEPRGTVIGNRLCAWTKLQENSGLGKPLSLLPQQLEDHSGKRYGHDNAEATRQGKAKPRMRPRRMLDWDSSQDSLFCDAPGERYAQLVFRSENSASLWSLKAIHSMCEMEQARIRSHSHFQDLCKQDRLTSNVPRVGQECCPSWSLGNYLAVLSNASSCLGLTTNQVSDSLTVLRQCAPYYHDGSLAPSCAKQGKLGQCATVPLQCKLSSAIYQILHYLVDKDFLAPQTIGYRLPSLKYSLLFLPVEKGDSMMKIYLDNLEGRDLTYSNTTITGMDLGIKRRLFKYYLAWDAVYPILAILILLLTTALYLRSFFLSAMSLAAILVSLFASYFFYTVVFRLTFFPFLNLIAVLVLLGSYCNQAFVFIDLWRIQLSQKPPASLEKRVHRVLQEIGYLILASGLTSSATFFSGYMSSITSVRCFAVYVGTASMISTFFSLVWLPCSLILRERYAVAAAAGNTCCSRNPGGFWDTSSRKRCMFTFVRKLRGLKRGLSDTSDLLFLKILPCGVVKFRYIWICWFTVLAAGGTYMTCVDPGMKLPTLESEAMQLFRSSHPFERYDSEYRHQFMFERLKSGEDRPMVVTLVWGVLPVDNGDHLNARSNGSMVMDKEFNMSTPEAQEWLRELCGRIQNQSFYAPLSSPEEATKGDNVCFVEHLLHWVSIRRCSENEDAFTFCCNNILFPYLPRVFEHCLGMMAAERYAESHTPSSAGPRFNSDGRVVALVIEFTTTHYYSFNFTQTSKFYKEIKTWFNAEMAGAPIGLHNGWFVSQLSLYDLQQLLSSEMLIVTNVGIALTFGLLLLTTWNIPLSIYGSLAVAGSVFVTAGLLVLLEWQLNGLEALFIAVASGLSIDFAANYCIAYSLAPHSDRLGRVAHSLKRMGCPAATGAAAYFCVGVIMLPANALLFRKLGIFLLVVKCVACGFATFFFQSLCCFFGPEKKCGQIVCPCSEVRVQYIEKGAENMLSPCSVVGPGKCNSTANGAFGCSRKSRGGQRSSGKDMSEGHLCPGRYRQRKRLEAEGMVPEQYELQPLACHLSDSFDNSTCTSKLSNRPSVLSDEIQFRSISPRRDMDAVSRYSENFKAPSPPPALQTSSPYKENSMLSVTVPPGSMSQDMVLCQQCRGQSSSIKRWNLSLSSSSSLEDIIISSQPAEVDHQQSPSNGRTNRPFESCPHQRLLSSQSQSSFEGLEDSNETCLSDIEPGPSARPHASSEAEAALQPGHLNGKRDTLRLSLKETVFEPGSSRRSQGEFPVILPNSKPDLPDVWIKREAQNEDSS